MKDDLMFLLKIILAFLPFILFVFLDEKANMKKAIRHKQFFMPAAALVYCIAMFALMDRISQRLLAWVMQLMDQLETRFVLPVLQGSESLKAALAKLDGPVLGALPVDQVSAALENMPFLNRLATAVTQIRALAASWGVILLLVLFNTAAIIVYVILKRILTAALHKLHIRQDSLLGKLVGTVYTYDETDDAWYVREQMGQARTFVKACYYACLILSLLVLLASCLLCRKQLIAAPFYPVFSVILVGEIKAFFDGLRKDEEKSRLEVDTDQARRIAQYPLLRIPLRNLFEDKLSSEGTTVNNGSVSGGSVEEILGNIEASGGRLGRNYAAFIRKKMDGGLKPDVDYVRSGYELSAGRSLLFNTPFYYKLTPFAFYAMNRHLLTWGKVLIVLGRHGTEEDLLQWCREGMMEVSNVPDLWKIRVLTAEKWEEDEQPDIGIISRSGVHDLDIHKANLDFLKKVTFVFIVEPSRLVATAQIGLNLLIKCCGKERDITYCSVDRNCDGLVDSLSHILMTNITEVSATEFPRGMSSYMCWTADSDYVQHRIVPGVSRYLGMGTELSMAALKNQVKKATWYGGETYPVLDAHWIAKQYYYDLLRYADLPTTQETFDKCFRTSFNLCNERCSDYSYVTVEDDRNNLFETRRSFATIAEQQGFVNVISSEYMLREYMTENTDLFTADAKAIPYITADFARTKRNAVLSLCLRLCIEGVTEEELYRELMLVGKDPAHPELELWDEMCELFCGDGPAETDRKGRRVIAVHLRGQARPKRFEMASTLNYIRRYSVERGEFESVYTIEDEDFAAIILDDLQNASYIAEQDGRDCFLGTELKGHIYQKYLPGQFFTLSGKYYEMVTVAPGNRILVRRASEHINGRESYRQVREYVFDRIVDSDSMGELKTINGIDIYHQFADLRVNTPAYWRMSAYNDFTGGACVELNGVPERRYFQKQILKLDFSKLEGRFTPEVRVALTALLNEAFMTLFADNQPFIMALTPGQHKLPLTCSLSGGEGVALPEECIYIVEDSQLDIGLLIAVERNLNRILQIISDYLAWNGEKIEESIAAMNAPAEETSPTPYSAYTLTPEEAAAAQKKKRKCLFPKLGAWLRKVFHRKDKTDKPKKEKKPRREKTRRKKDKSAPAEGEVMPPVREERPAEPPETAAERIEPADEAEAEPAEPADEAAAEPAKPADEAAAEPTEPADEAEADEVKAPEEAPEETERSEVNEDDG